MERCFSELTQPDARAAVLPSNFIFTVMLNAFKPKHLLLCLSAVWAFQATNAAIVGTNVPPPPLSVERVKAEAPEASRAAWLLYLEDSARQWAADRAVIAAEREGLASWPADPESSHGAESMPLDKPAAWYGSEEALAIARNVLSYQTPAGGWGKNQPRNRPPRARGQSFVSNNNSPRATSGDFDLAKDPAWSYVGTVDNDATITEIRFLTRVANQASAADAARYRDAAHKGLKYLLRAQFPNGGWPQVWPLQGGYHDAITLNDNAVVDVAELMAHVAAGASGFDFIPTATRQQAASAVDRAIALLLAAQLRENGQPTIWAQQYDALSLSPVSARNYEPGSPCTSESAQVMIFLMSLPQPSTQVQTAVRAAAATLERIAVHGVVFDGKGSPEGRRLRDKPGAPALWARYYTPGTWKPLFGDRDKSLHDDVNELTQERRNGYSWWGNWPAATLKTYEAWSRKWPDGPKASPAAR